MKNKTHFREEPNIKKCCLSWIVFIVFRGGCIFWKVEKRRNLAMCFTIDRRPPSKLQGKRLYDHGGSSSRCFTLNVKRQRLEATPQFLRDCRPSFEPPVGKTRGLKTIVLTPVNPLRESRHLVKKDLESSRNKQVASQEKDDFSKPIVNLKNVEETSSIELEKVDLARVRGNGTLATRSESLDSRKTSPKPAPYSTKYPPPKIQTGVNVVRDLPSGCGDHFSHDFCPRCGEMPSSVSPSKCKVVASGNCPLIQRPLEEMVKKCDKEPEVNEDGGAYGRKLEVIHSEEVVYQVQADSGKVVANDRCKLVCRPSECEPKQVEVGINGGARMGTSSANCSREKLSGDRSESSLTRLDTIKLLEPNSSENYSLFPAKKAMDAMLRESGNFLLVKESNIQNIVPRWVDLNRIKVGKVLHMFDDIYGKLLQRLEAKPKFERKKAGQISVTAAGIAKQQLKGFKMNERVFGAVPGIEVGDQFRFRAQLALIGLHCQYCSGIDYMKKDGKNFAISIVDSGRYGYRKASDHYTGKIESGSPDVFFYSGQGGNPQVASGEPEDQKLEGGNLALKNSMEAGTSVRVIRKLQTFRASYTGAKSGKIPAFVYDGLYVVSNCTQERGPYGKLIFKFQFNRINGQPELTKCLASTSGKLKVHHDCHVVDGDISQGAEKLPIRALNTLNDEKPPRFKYVTKMVYVEKLDKVPSGCGCDCINGCSDFEPCSCLIKNGGEIPFNDNGAILKAKSVVYECGSFCKCPPSCKNRVSQNGVRYQLEIFKTESKGWGVRSRNFIARGSFICEYVGELLTEKEAEERTNNDTYLFDIGNNYDNHAAAPGESMGHPHWQSNFSKRTDEDGFTIDAMEYGNIGRFINHSCSPNLFAQDVLYDHNDKRRPHVMFFASENIPPLREITFDYNYKIDQIRDANGNIKKKNCYCGARNCIGRMY